MPEMPSSAILSVLLSVKGELRERDRGREKEETEDARKREIGFQGFVLLLPSGFFVHAVVDRRGFEGERRADEEGLRGRRWWEATVELVVLWFGSVGACMCFDLGFVF